jgi:DNA-binding NarL/FixJ family response regulator
MISFILIISFLLHMITFAAIYQILKQMQTIKQSNTSDIQEVLEIYLKEIREENNRLQKAVSGEHSHERKQPAQTADNLDFTIDNTIPEENQIYENEKKDYMETSQHSRILQLYDKGLSESEIAQKLNCGKTEAALIIKLYGKK